MSMTPVSLASGKAVPSGIYDLVHKSGFVNVGIDHDTAEFAVESIRRWWHLFGKKLYPDRREMLITADSGGSNGAKNRLCVNRGCQVGRTAVYNPAETIGSSSTRTGR